MIGHGTFNGKVAKFSLRGPDVSSAELGEMLKGVSRPLVIADCTSCSAPFLADLERREVRCVVAQRSELDDPEPWPLVHRRFDPEIRAAVRARFIRDDALSTAGLSVWRRRE